MDKMCRASTPLCACCSSINVPINVLAPASSTNDAAICITAKARSRRFVPPVIRTLPLDRPNPCAVSAEGNRGTNASSTEAMTASTAPTHNMVESTVRSKARTENCEA